MSGLVIVGAVATIISTVVAAFVAAWGAKVSARAKAAEAKNADRAANNESIEIGQKVLIDGIGWSQSQLTDLRTANTSLIEDLAKANTARFAAERRLSRSERENSDLKDQNDMLREQLSEAVRQARANGESKHD